MELQFHQEKAAWREIDVTPKKKNATCKISLSTEQPQELIQSQRRMGQFFLEPVLVSETSVKRIVCLALSFE